MEARYTAHLVSADDGKFDGTPIQVNDSKFTYQELTPKQKEFNGKQFRMRPIRFVENTLYFSQYGAIHRGTFDTATNTLGAVERIGAGTSFGIRAEDSFFILQHAGSSPSLIPDFHRESFESQSLFVVDTAGTKRLLLAESRLMELDACPLREEIAAIFNDGDGSLKLAFLPVQGFHAEPDQIEIDPSKISFPLQPRALDEVRHPRYSPDCSRLYYSRRYGDDHDIAYWDFSAQREVIVTNEEAFELYPEPTDVGVYYVSARDGAMNIYLKPEGKPALNISQAITSHHHIASHPSGVAFGRFYSTGLQLHFLPSQQGANEPVSTVHAKEPVKTLTLLPPPEKTKSYFGIFELVPPTFVPIVSWEFTHQQGSERLRLQGGLEFAIEDQLRQHWLLVRAFAGNRSNIHVSYLNRSWPVDFSLWGGMSKIKGLYSWENNGDSYARSTTYHWGYMGLSASLPLNLFYDLQASAQTIRDTGTLYGAAELPVNWLEPRFGRDLVGLSLEYVGIDQSSPLYSPRTVNRQGYRKFELELYYGREYINPWLTQFDSTLPAGYSGFFRGEFNYTEYITLPRLARGFFDHTLQIDLQLGYISRDVRFLPFIGGGRLYSMTLPELNTSVGFVGYRFFSLRGETALNLGLTYRFPIARKLGADLGNLFIEDIYGQFFTSWGNIWGYKEDGTRQIPFVDKASNGQHILGDIGFDLRINHFWGELNGNFGTTLRAAYRLMPFTNCAPEDHDSDGICPPLDQERALSVYLILGGGF